MILFSKYLIPKNYTGLAIYPFIFLKNKSLSDNWVLINHERIHLKQQLEFLFRFVQLRNWNDAYKNISFEKESYENEGNPNYLNERKTWSFINYL